ncbi:MAG: hypothetical protein V4637_14755 [Pseudomonadota bacterium]
MQSIIMQHALPVESEIRLNPPPIAQDHNENFDVKRYTRKT